jgi:microcystin-dependent protein
MPSGAVVAFDLPACPTGWADMPALAGRTVVGVGAGQGLNLRNLGDSGGEEQHTMTIGELAQHQHGLTVGASDKGGRGNGYAYSDNAGGSTVLQSYTLSTGSAGGGAPFNVMMPWYALRYCVKQ